MAADFSSPNQIFCCRAVAKSLIGLDLPLRELCGTRVANLNDVDAPAERKVWLWTLAVLVVLWLGVYLTMLLTPVPSDWSPAREPHTVDAPPFEMPHVPADVPV